MKTRLFLLSFFGALCAHTCLADSIFIFGVRGGVPLGNVVQSVNNDTNVFSSSEDKYVVGPTIGIRLPLGFSVTGDALFTHLNFSANSGSVSASAASLEFPILARFTPGSGPLRPFVGAGASVRHLGNLGNVGSFFSDSSSSSIEKSLGVGFVIAGGVEFKLGPVHIDPEIRYTHWGSNNVSNAFNNIVKLNDNEGQVLLGITF